MARKAMNRPTDAELAILRVLWRLGPSTVREVHAELEPREEVQRGLVGDLGDRAFDGSASQLVLRALSSRPASEAELTEIRRLLDELEGGAR